MIDWMFEIWPKILFLIMALTTVGCSIAVVVTQNVVRAAVWLLLTLTGTAGLFFLLGADFVGATQLLIYVGGTLILVIFGVMLTARGPFVQMKTRSGEWAMASIVGLVLLALLAPAIARAKWRAGPGPSDAASRSVTAANSPTTVQLGLEFLGVPPAGTAPALESPGDNAATDQDQPANAATPGLSGEQAAVLAAQRVRNVARDPAGIGYLLPFEIVSVHLLVVMIGAAYLARAKRRKRAAGPTAVPLDAAANRLEV